MLGPRLSFLLQPVGVQALLWWGALSLLALVEADSSKGSTTR